VGWGGIGWIVPSGRLALTSAQTSCASFSRSTASVGRASAARPLPPGGTVVTPSASRSSRGAHAAAWAWAGRLFPAARSRAAPRGSSSPRAAAMLAASSAMVRCAAPGLGADLPGPATPKAAEPFPPV